MAIIGIDFDGTICEHEFPKIGKLKEDAKKVIQKLKDKGHDIIIWTCRDDEHDEKYLTKAIEWLKEKDIPYDYINENKPGLGFDPKPKIYYDVLLDDRNLFSPMPFDWDLAECRLKLLGIL